MDGADCVHRLHRRYPMVSTHILKGHSMFRSSSLTQLNANCDRQTNQNPFAAHVCHRPNYYWHSWYLVGHGPLLLGLP